jgi:CBS domain-containing protein
MLNAASIMSRDVVTAGPDDTVARVAQVLARHKISAVPVCDPTGGLLGMVSEGDLMRPYLSSNIQRRAWWLALLADGTDLAPEFLEYVRVDRHQVGDLMTKPVITASETAPDHRSGRTTGEASGQAIAHRPRRQTGRHCQPRRCDPRNRPIA